MFVPQISMNVHKDLNYAFALTHRWLFWLYGVWPDPNIPVSNFRRINVRFIIGLCIVILYTMIPEVINIIDAWGNMMRMVESIASLNFTIMLLNKIIVTWYYNETLRLIVKSMLADWMASSNNQPRERDTMLKIARKGRTLAFQCYIITTMAILFYTSFNLVRLYRNIMLQQQQRRLLYHFTYLYSQKSPNYEITYLIQIFCGIYIAFGNCTVDIFISVLLLHACAQLINLRAALNDLVSELANHSISSSRFRQRLATIVTWHKHIIRNAKTINNCYSITLFIHMLVATFQLCFKTFQAFMIISDVEFSILKMALVLCYAIAIIIHLYIYCYSAERLLTESIAIAYGVYESKWYKLSANDARNLIFIMYRSKIPLRLTAGKFGIFSIETFAMTIKTAMGYFSALLTMRN